MKVLHPADIPADSGIYGRDLSIWREKMAAEFTANFYILKSVTYDSKTDRFVVTFETLQGEGARKFSFKCSNDVASFLAGISDRSGQFYIKVENGAVIDVLFFDYNHA